MCGECELANSHMFEIFGTVDFARGTRKIHIQKNENICEFNNSHEANVLKFHSFYFTVFFTLPNIRKMKINSYTARK